MNDLVTKDSAGLNQQLVANQNALGPAVLAQNWELVGPRHMCCGAKINDVDIGGGRKWTLERSKNGMDLILTTDLQFDSEEEADGRPFKVYVLRGAPIAEQLIRGLLGK